MVRVMVACHLNDKTFGRPPALLEIVDTFAVERYVELGGLGSPSFLGAVSFQKLREMRGGR